MKTNIISGKKVHIITLGCSKNLVDSENLLALLQGSGFDVAHDPDKINGGIVVINTCGFIQDAKQESVDTILRFADARKNGLIDQLLVSGCLVQRYARELKEEIPEVDAWFGTEEFRRIIKHLRGDYKKELLGQRLLSTPSHYAYLKISEGCDRKCSFCTIPSIRGKHRSTPIAQLLEQAAMLAEKGVKELILVAQDLTYYGLDINGSRCLDVLLKKLAEVRGIEWIRLHYAFPEGFPMDVLEVMSNSPKICRYLDIPFQHISERVLRSMRRGTNKEKINRLVEETRKRVDGIALRTTLITGYPGETEQEFSELLDWVETMRFERLGVFTYSHEEGTHAYELPDDVPEQVKKSRAEAIMELQAEVSDGLNKRFLGRVIPVLLDRREGQQWIGRTEFDSPEVDNEVVIRHAADEMRAGMITPVRIVASDAYTLFGEQA